MLLTSHFSAILMLVPTDSTKMATSSLNQQEFWMQLLPLIIAAIAVFFGPLIQLYLGKRQLNAQVKIAQEQLRASVRSNNRQQWIHTLRDLLSEFASQLGGLMYNMDKDGKPIDLKAHIEKAERLVLIQTKISLLLNPDKPDHKEIIGLADKVRLAAVNREMARAEVYMDELAAKSQALFKLTWERIKRLE